MDRENALQCVQNVLENWKDVCRPEHDGHGLTVEGAAYHLYEVTGFIRRLGIELPEEVTRVINERGTIEKGILYIELEADRFYDSVRSYLLDCEREDARKESDEFMESMLGDEAQDIVVFRDKFECAIREIARRMPDDGTIRSRLIRVSTTFARTDWIMRAGIKWFAHLSAITERMRADFVEGTVDPIHQWWFFDLGAFARGELLMEEIMYGCVDPINFPEWRIADYLGGPDSEEEKLAVEAHLARCEDCRASVEDATMDEPPVS